MILIYSLTGGGAERAATQLANHWASEGHLVTCVLYGPQSEGSDYLLAEAVEVLPLGGPAAAGPAAVLRRVLRLRRMLDRLDPDAVIGMTTTGAVLAAFAGVGRPWRSIGSERAAPAWQPPSRVWRAMRWATYGLLDLVLAQTRTAADWLRAHTLARRVSVIPNGVEWPLPGAAAGRFGREPRAGDSRIVLSAGRLSSEKDFATLIDSFGRLAPDNPEWDLVILGEGPERGDLEARIRSASLEERVRLPGRAADISSWYAKASIFAMSSRNEGFPNVLLEAMAAGLPVVSRDCDDGPREIVRNGVDGFLTPVHDLEAFTAALGRLMAEPKLRRRMSRRALEVRDRFSQPRIMALWDAVLSEKSALPTDGADLAEAAQHRVS